MSSNEVEEQGSKGSESVEWTVFGTILDFLLPALCASWRDRDHASSPVSDVSDSSGGESDVSPLGPSMKLKMDKNSTSKLYESDKTATREVRRQNSDSITEVAPFPTLPHAESRRVRWLPQVSVILIPCKEEYYAISGMAQRLWYDHRDYESFKEEAGEELRDCAIEFQVSPMAARQILYGLQDFYVDDHDTWAIGGVSLPTRQQQQPHASPSSKGHPSNHPKRTALRAPSISLMNAEDKTEDGRPLEAFNSRPAGGYNAILSQKKSNVTPLRKKDRDVRARERRGSLVTTPEQEQLTGWREFQHTISSESLERLGNDVTSLVHGPMGVGPYDPTRSTLPSNGNEPDHADHREQCVTSGPSARSSRRHNHHYYTHQRQQVPSGFGRFVSEGYSSPLQSPIPSGPPPPRDLEIPQIPHIGPGQMPSQESYDQLPHYQQERCVAQQRQLSAHKQHLQAMANQFDNMRTWSFDDYSSGAEISLHTAGTDGSSDSLSGSDTGGRFSSLDSHSPAKGVKPRPVHPFPLEIPEIPEIPNSSQSQRRRPVPRGDSSALLNSKLRHHQPPRRIEELLSVHQDPSLPVVVMEASPPFAVRYANAGWTQLYQKSFNECVGSPLFDTSVFKEGGADASLVDEISAELQCLAGDNAMTLPTMVGTPKWALKPQILRIMAFKCRSEDQGRADTPLSTTTSEGGGDTDHEDDRPIGDQSDTDTVEGSQSGDAKKKDALMDAPPLSGSDCWEWSRESQPFLVGVSLCDPSKEYLYM